MADDQTDGSTDEKVMGDTARRPVTHLSVSRAASDDEACSGGLGEANDLLAPCRSVAPDDVCAGDDAMGSQIVRDIGRSHLSA